MQESFFALLPEIGININQSLRFYDIVSIRSLIIVIIYLIYPEVF